MKRKKQVSKTTVCLIAFCFINYKINLKNYFLKQNKKVYLVILI